ncbi:MAG TPA: hypothetical protein VL200_12255 [Lacunisphaera sp.]|jgi:hypothetical protein|nr:hypothetical protein [Lacunisphaera sp.]
MRPWFLGLVLPVLAAGLRAGEEPRAATAAEIALFKDAIKNTEQDPNHWAYTETTVKRIGLHGKPKGETIVRFDPSKPWPEQYTPLQIEGRPPTEMQRQKYRERGEQRGRAFARRQEEAAAAADPTAPARPTRPAKKERSVTADLEHPRVVSDDGETMVFDVPLIEHGTGVPVEKIEVRAVVAKGPRQVRHASLRVKDSFRLKMVAKVKAGEASVDFAVVDPNFGPVMTAAVGSFGASLMFVPVHGVFSTTRTDWRRVKSYDERLQVKLAPLQLLGF